MCGIGCVVYFFVWKLVIYCVWYVWKMYCVYILKMWWKIWVKMIFFRILKIVKNFGKFYLVGVIIWNILLLWWVINLFIMVLMVLIWMWFCVLSVSGCEVLWVSWLCIEVFLGGIFVGVVFGFLLDLVLFLVFLC